MDPQTAAFMPRDDIWRINSEMSRIQQIQQEHTERLSRLERRQDDDARTKSIWGSSSPFPGVLAGTPQQRPIEQPPADAFSGFDDQSSNLLGSLHLDAEDEPRRVGATSRANSVRFDETANQGHWSHPNRSSLDLLPRSGSSLGSHPLMERTYSHKSDGRQSSAGHSVHSVASRANSLGIDMLNGLGAGDGRPLNPGLLLLGTCPSIIRCWLTTKFKHDTLLYAAICSGSFSSFISLQLIQKLGFGEQILQEDGIERVKLSVYLPEATVRSASSRSSSPAPQLPTIAVDFVVVPQWGDDRDKVIRIVLGSDVLRSHSADILFSSNSLVIYDDEHSKLSIPLVRPEDDSTFSRLRTLPLDVSASESAARAGSPSGRLAEDEAAKSAERAKDSITSQSLSNQPKDETQEGSRSSLDSRSSRPPLGLLNTSEDSQPQSTTPSLVRDQKPKEIWNSWRRDPDKPGPSTEPTWGKSSSTYQRREQGIKVLRPLKSSSRISTGATPSSASPSASQSRFFEEGRRRTSSTDGGESGGLRKTLSAAGGAKEAGKTPTSANPVGGGSAFSWLAK